MLEEARASLARRLRSKDTHMEMNPPEIEPYPAVRYISFFARFCSGQVLEITRVAAQTIDSTHVTHVLAHFATQAGFVTRCILMLSFGAIFTFG